MTHRDLGDSEDRKPAGYEFLRGIRLRTEFAERVQRSRGHSKAADALRRATAAIEDAEDALK